MLRFISILVSLFFVSSDYKIKFNSKWVYKHKEKQIPMIGVNFSYISLSDDVKYGRNLEYMSW